MKNIHVVGLLFISFISDNLSFAATEELEEMSNQVQPINHSLSELLSDFKSQNPRFDYGITSVKTLYDKNIDIDDFYTPKQPYSILRKAVFL